MEKELEALQKSAAAGGDGAPPKVEICPPSPKSAGADAKYDIVIYSFAFVILLNAELWYQNIMAFRYNFILYSTVIATSVSVTWDVVWYAQQNKTFL